MKIALLTLALGCATFLVGCPESAPDDDGVLVNNVTSNNVAPNSVTNASSNNAVSSTYASVVVEVVEVEWGLFGSPQVRTEVVEALDEGNFATAQLEIEPGAFALRITAGSEVVLDVTGTGADRLVPVTGEVSTQPFFNPSTLSAEIEVREDAGIWTATIAPRDAGPALATDDPGALTDAGAWFEKAFEEVAPSDDPGGAVVELMHGMRERGGPIHTSSGVLFIAPAQDGESPPQIRGTWNDFGADPDSELHRITPGFWARFIQLPAGRHEYKIYYPSADAWVTDIANPHIAWDGFDPSTVGAFNSVIEPDGERMVWLPQTHSSELGNTREAYVQLPSSYDANQAKQYPVLYLHDGNESIVRGQFHIIASETGAADPTTEVILVFLALPSQNVRIDEYTLGTAGSLGDAYVDFVAQTLVPQIEAQFRTRTQRNARGIAGASLGGLISFWASMRHPDVFGYSAGMSSTFFWGDDFIIDEIQSRGCQDVAYYLDSGSPNDNFEVTQTMRDVLEGLGCDYEYVLEANGQHDWAFWRGRFGGVLMDFAQTHGG